MEVRFPVIDIAFRALNALRPASPAAAVIDVQTWPSLAFKQDIERRAAEERAQQERIAREAQQRAEAEARAQAAREAAMAAAARSKMLRGVARVAGGAGVLAILVFLRRRWIWPTIQTVVASGTHVQVPAALTLGAGQREAIPGAIVETAWARGRFGRRHRLKVETLAGASADDRLDVLVSAGATVRPGAYLARLSSGAVRVAVTRKV